MWSNATSRLIPSVAITSMIQRLEPQAAQAYNAKLAKRRDYKTLYWEFTRFSKILEYCCYCGDQVYLSSVHRVLLCCVHFAGAI